MSIVYQCRMPSNMHGHLRLGNMLQVTAPHAAKYNYYYTAMGNHKNKPTSTPERATDYRKMIEKIAPGLRVNVPCYIQEGADQFMIKRGFETGAWCASKLMPRGVTTHSEEGVRPSEMHTLYEAYEMHEVLGMLALFHGMRPHDPIGREIGWFDQEKRFIDLLGEQLVRTPRLKVVFEHITTREAVSFVRYCQKHGYLVDATVAPQYLLHSTNWLFDGGMNPGHYSIPPMQDELHQEALIDFVTMGHGFRGNDSAPHDEKMKALYCGCMGGIYSDAFGLDLIAYYMVFKAAGALERYEDFVSLKGPAFYGLDPTPKSLTMKIVEEEWRVPEFIEHSAGRIIPLFAGEKLPYRVLAG